MTIIRDVLSSSRHRNQQTDKSDISISDSLAKITYDNGENNSMLNSSSQKNTFPKSNGGFAGIIKNGPSHKSNSRTKYKL